MNMADLAATKWRRSSACDNSSGSCLEVAILDDAVITRDSKDPEYGVQTYTRDEWAAFTTGVKRGEFDA